METKSKFTRFSVEQSDKKIVWETPYEDVTGEDCMKAIETLLTGLTFLPPTIYRILRDYVEDVKFLYEKEENEQD